MRNDLRQAAERLAAALDRENQILVALDFGAVAELLQEKRASLDVLRALVPDAETLALDAQDETARELAKRLQSLAATNKHLLEHAIDVQNRVMAVLASAARQLQVPRGYGARGNRAVVTAGQAYAVLVRA